MPGHNKPSSFATKDHAYHVDVPVGVFFSTHAFNKGARKIKKTLAGPFEDVVRAEPYPEHSMDAV